MRFQIKSSKKKNSSSLYKGLSLIRTNSPLGLEAKEPKRSKYYLKALTGQSPNTSITLTTKSEKTLNSK